MGDRAGGRAGAALVGVLALALFASLGCEEPPPGDAVKIGVLLAYTGYRSANSTSSERALLMAIEAANQAGGISGRPIRLIARDTHSDPDKVTQPARELLAQAPAMFIGLDTPETALPLRDLLGDYTIIMPSFATSHSPFRRPFGWFVMGTGTARIACELVAQMRAAGRTHPVVLADASGYNGLVAWELTRRYALPQLTLPPPTALNPTSVKSIVGFKSAGIKPDAYVLVALPPNATSLVYAMAAAGAIGDPKQWYLSPTLHTPALLETIPAGTLAGARGVSPGTVAGAGDFRAAFAARWHDMPLDDAYSFYDAGAVAVLALARAQARDGKIPALADLSKHVVAVTHGREPIGWDEIGLGIQKLREGAEVEYFGLSGIIEFDLSGQTPAANTNWWTIGAGGFADIPHTTECADHD
jgi:ABC-type branched-subunit amino acid transport system substrate-binding protein